MIRPRLFSELRAARKAGTLTPALMAELMDACHRPILAGNWRATDPTQAVELNHTGLEYFIREAKSRNGRK